MTAERRFDAYTARYEPRGRRSGALGAGLSPLLPTVDENPARVIVQFSK